jgi:hypothetical protein
MLSWRVICGTGNASEPEFRVAEYLGEPSEGVGRRVLGMDEPGAQKKSRMAGETKRSAVGAVLSIQVRMRTQNGVAVV